ncbi:MAG: hypothetical protein ACFB8W_04500 [Elainellaceae cyanobacterium]
MPNISRPFFPEKSPEIEILEAHWATYSFHREVRHREELEAYCQWYCQVAEEHRREFAAMQRELNILAWFGRGG